jgi:hypothetical protein
MLLGPGPGLATKCTPRAPAPAKAAGPRRGSTRRLPTARSTITDDIKTRSGELGDVQWSADGSQLAFVSSSRDHKIALLREANAETADVRDVLEEKVATFFESGNGRSSWRFLPASREVIWFSQRDNWGQLYLYDLYELKTPPPPRGRPPSP